MRETLGRLAVLQAICSAVGEEVKTRTPGNLRWEADEEARRMYERDGITSFGAFIGDTKVGTFRVNLTKPEEERRETVFSVSSTAALYGWEVDPEEAAEWARDRMEDFARWHFARTGELPPGCELEEIVRPACAGGEWKNTTLTVDGRKVAEAMGNELGGVARALLEGASDD